MAIAQLVLEYVKVLLGWPVITAVIAITFLVRFRIPLSALINRVASIKMPGGAELMTPLQAIANEREDALRPPSSMAAPPDAAAPATAPAPAGARDEAQQRANSERERSALWEYRYLNYYLVPRTQIVLDWLASREPTTYGTYDSLMMPFIPNPAERAAVIHALENHHLVDVNRNQGNLVTVTPKGREYIEWRGPAEKFLGPRPPAPVEAPPSIAALESIIDNAEPSPEARGPHADA